MKLHSYDNAKLRVEPSSYTTYRASILTLNEIVHTNLSRDEKKKKKQVSYPHHVGFKKKNHFKEIFGHNYLSVLLNLGSEQT